MRKRNLEEVTVMIGDVVAKVENYHEKAVSVICAAAGRDVNDASQYADAVMEVAKRYGRFDSVDIGLIGNTGVVKERISNNAAQKSLHSNVSKYNYNMETLELERATSLYGLWNKIERSVKRMKNDSFEELNNERHDIEREVKKTGREIKGFLGDAISEEIIRLLANCMNQANRDYRECRMNRSNAAGPSRCGDDAIQAVVEFGKHIKMLPNVGEDVDTITTWIRNMGNASNWPSFKSRLLQYVPDKYKGMFHY